ncbi:MAG: TFIIB-type zinc finger domain-containing protein [Eubacteriales bacterium]
MKRLTCEMCGGTDLIKQDGVFVCQYCGTKYSVEEARKMMIDGTVDVQGTVKIDNSAFVQKYFENARRAYSKEDWEEVEKYYNMVEQNSPNNMEAVFFSSFGKAMLSLTDNEYFKREQKFGVLNRSISVINDYFEVSDENKEEVLRKISDAIEKMYSVTFVYGTETNQPTQADRSYTIRLENSVRAAFLTELKQIKEAHADLTYLDELISKNSKQVSVGGCYVATAVYGSYDCPQVWTLRRYRDCTLSKTWYGRAFIGIYYAVSPTLVKWFGHTDGFKKMWKKKLDRMVARLKSDGVEDTPYEDRDW